MTRPLEGILVVDLTVVLSGPATTMALADLGADVIRVESRRHYPSATKGPQRVRAESVEQLGNTRRGYADRDPGDEPWHRFAVANVNGRGKRSLTIELDTPAGRKVFEDLVRAADVLAENNSPGFLERRGFPPRDLFALNPRLVLLRMPGGAETGPLAAIRGMGPAFEALAGLRDLRGYADLGPQHQPESMYMDAATGPAAVAAVVAALRRRETTGLGVYVVISQLGVMMDQAADQYCAAQRGPNPPAPRENFSWHMAPHGIYRCAGDDEWLAIACRDDTEWRALYALVSTENPGAPVPRSASLKERLEAWEAVDHWLTSWARTVDKHDAFVRAQRQGVTAAPVMREGELLADRHLEARGFFLDLDHPVIGRRQTPGPPWRSSRWEPATPDAAPLLGEHNEKVLRDVLGYSAATYQRLVDEGEIGTDYL